MSAANSSSWGNWIMLRARAIGFRRQLDLAAAIGCSENQLSRWATLDQPPEIMRKGFDRALAAVLQVDRETLFHKWAQVSAESPLIKGEPSDSADESALRRKVQAIAELLGPAQLGELHDKGRALLADASAA